MEQHIPQEEIRRIIISDMVKKRGTIVPIIGDDTIVYREKNSGEEIPFQEFILREFQKKYPHVDVNDADVVSMRERGYYGLSLMSQYYERRFLDDFMDFVNDNRSCIKLKDEVLDFLVTFNFPIIITTVCFDIIEQQLKGKLEDYKSIWYRMNKENSTLPTRCVYHIFGQAKDGAKWVSDEDLLLSFLLSHNHNDYGAKGLTDYLKENEKKLLALGCNLPNWLFRFLWQPIQAGRTSSMKTTQGYSIYFFIGIVGYFLWRPGNRDAAISVYGWKTRVVWGLASIFIIVFSWIVLSKTDNPLPLLDSITSVTSMVATWFMFNHKLKAWIVWLLNDVFYITEYFMLPDKALYLIGLYVVWTILAIVSYVNWRRLYAFGRKM